MKVYRDRNGDTQLIGRADVPGDLPFLDIPLFGRASVITDRYTISTVTTLQGTAPPIVERAVLLAPGQLPELLPGWTPLAS